MRWVYLALLASSALLSISLVGLAGYALGIDGDVIDSAAGAVHDWAIAHGW